MPFTSKVNVVAVGPELTSTAAVLKGDRCYPTQHLGDVESPESVDFLDEAVSHTMKLLGVKEPGVVALDLHPNFLSRGVATDIAERFGADMVEVQHHHAHLASASTPRRRSWGSSATATATGATARRGAGRSSSGATMASSGLATWSPSPCPEAISAL
jgi:hydrogenase maturation protein HypF